MIAPPLHPRRAASLDWIDPCLDLLPAARAPSAFSVQATRIAASAVDWLFVALASLAAALCVAVDVLVFGHGLSEFSLSETAQHSLLLACVALFVADAVRRPGSRAFSILAAGFFACLLVRELDVFLDWIRHGFWIWPAGLLAAASVLAAALSPPDSLWKPMADFLESRAGILLASGLVVLIVFSRLFGSGALWQPLVSPDHCVAVKSTVQEGVELLGYVFAAGGARLHVSSAFPPSRLKVCRPT